MFNAPLVSLFIAKILFPLLINKILNNEIVRISSGLNVSTGVANVLRGVLGTKAESHENTAIAREVKPVATELRRYSTIRASGHTFEYLGLAAQLTNGAFEKEIIIIGMEVLTKGHAA